MRHGDERISGVVTTRDALHHSFIILYRFGPAVMYRVLRAIVRHERTTFLACVFGR